MKKSETTNTFAGGLVMDINPLVASNDGLCNALNATLVTMNGNENVLQNDMGNGRVETAYLPEGYVPLGTAELGGIIYIVSYNPLNKRCLIGSFPSPERNISSDEIIDLEQSLTNLDFKYLDDTGALVYYLKKELNSELTFNPGDKFIVYGDTIQNNFEKLYKEEDYYPPSFNNKEDSITKLAQHTLKLAIGTLTTTGKLVKFTDLKEYQISNKGLYHIFQYTSTSENNTPDLDHYRSLVSLPYNIFDSKISGRLVLIAELVLFNNFEISIQSKFSTSDGKKYYTPSITTSFTGDYPFIPKGIRCKISILGNDITKTILDTIDYIVSKNDLERQVQDHPTSYTFDIESFLKEGNVWQLLNQLADGGYFNKDVRDGHYILKYEIIPYMNWGPVSYLTKSGQIDLDKLGTGYINLTLWRYYNENNLCLLSWGLETYEEEGMSVQGVKFELTRFISSSIVEKNTYTISKKASYFGNFNEIIPFNLDYFKLEKQLEPNNLYLVKIVVTYGDLSQPMSREIPFYRWLYTNKIFNLYYDNTNDFKDLTLNFNTSLTVDCKTNHTEVSSVESLGTLLKVSESAADTDKEDSSSLSAILRGFNYTTSGTLEIGLELNWGTFYLEAAPNAFIIDKADGSKISASANIKYTDGESMLNKDLLKSDGLLTAENLSNYEITSNSSADTIMKIPTYIAKIGDFQTESSGNNYSFTLMYSSLLTVKAYCHKTVSNLVYEGKFLPLAYDVDTFNNYNLELRKDSSNSYFIPSIMGTYGFWEQKRADGRWVLGSWPKGDPEEETVKTQDKLDIHWTKDTKVITLLQQFGWRNTAIIVVHKFNYAPTHKNWLNYGGTNTQYSGPININGERTIRFQLFMQSNLGDEYFYPIDFSAALTNNKSYPDNGDNDAIKTLCSESTFEGFFDYYAQLLNNIYRYDPTTISLEYIVPLYIYWMDNCKYSLTIPLKVTAKDKLLENSKIGLQLKGKDRIKLGDLIDKLKESITLPDKTPESLNNNITYTISSLSSKALSITVSNEDTESGIKLRNIMLNLATPSIKLAMLDYDGKTIIGSSATAGDPKALYMRKGNNIVKASDFRPKKINFNISNTTGSIVFNQQQLKADLDTGHMGQDLNKKFTLNDDGLLVLKDPKFSDYSFVRVSGAGNNGIVDGYIKARLLSLYSSYYDK